ncbi:ArdC family protein [Pedobacter sp. MC2016-24]|uniref:ArdC family protein n=1 Tax=Pedobacter sp. MC2016-24 TaxID=2780090 RepID=UPI00187DE8C7|nr:zincin-like metallopeptidase domain-containing protein [Pedobacter sp. MC2016-24]MBE9602653.1 DUF1738 domain-containing protein [Pedobacter sp. MC2016-24]
MKTVSQKQSTYVRKDIQQEITDKIIAQLEAGTIPWKKPFAGPDHTILGLPYNFTTDNKYRGINILLLWGASLEKEYQSNEWASFKQWNAKGESVRKGENGHTIAYYDNIIKEVDGEIEKIPFLKVSKVFNRCQLASYEPVQQEYVMPDNLVEKLDNIEDFISNTKAIVETGSHEAYYTRLDDKIVMPKPETFIDTDYNTATENYYSVLFHELTHWTGNVNRLDRINHKRFGDGNYAREELVAELGAAFLGASFEIISAEPINSAAYIDHWLKVLKDDKQIIFTAASHASKAVDYLYELQPK